MARRTPGRRRALAALTAVAVALPIALGASPAQAQQPDAALSAAPSAYRTKTEAGVLAQLDAKDRATFWVALTHEADTSAARRAKGKSAKARTLYETKLAYAKSIETTCSVKSGLCSRGGRGLATGSSAGMR